ncbi:MAG: ATP-binding cassette domain-containing protein [Treponema sp.]|nr:ATP-binding cassette domain-containing protein [Treponema sp.]
MDKEKLISIENCSVRGMSKTYLRNISWEMKGGEAWPVTGPNGGGKADFINALAGRLSFVPEEDFESKAPSSFYSDFEKSVAVVSLEEAARLIEEERSRDESEIMDKEDEGRTGRQYIAEVLGGSSKKHAPLPPVAHRLETFPQVKLCGVEKILDRGLRYMSTGEIRRTLLCRALLSGCRLLILSDPFAGLDVDSRKILLEFFDTITGRQLGENAGESGLPRIILSMERFHEIPKNVNRVLEFSERRIVFSGTRDDYESLLKKRAGENAAESEKKRRDFLSALEKIRETYGALVGDSIISDEKIGGEKSAGGESLIRFENVNVGWGENHVLRDLSWEVKSGCHWLIRGPNGSGKTTILELITGDNMQVFRERIFLFGKKRGSGETIWDIKKKLGIVSYRLHVEYRMVGGTSLLETVISGFHDSIGLYEQATDFEIASAREWLSLGGFAGRENETFGSLSYGEQRAILILRAAVKLPCVLILDEPCHGLDENNRGKILALLETVGNSGTTTLLHVTHDASEVLPCEKHVLELHPAQDPMWEVKER